MADQRNRWKWDVSGFEARNSSSPPPPSVDSDRPRRRESAQLPRYSIPSISPSNRALTSKVDRLSRNLKVAKEDYLELRQEASELQEYSRAKLDRVTRYLGVLADKTRELDQVALEAESRIAPLINEKKKLFDDLLTAKGNIKVICRARPLFEDEGSLALEFPDDFSITVDTGDENSILKKDFEFDRVYGPHVGQAELFNGIQPFVQSTLDGFNVSIFAYGQTNSGKTHTLVGSSHERGLIVRCFEELFDLANSATSATSRFDFSLTVLEIHNEQVRDLLLQSGRSSQKTRIGSPEYFVELVQEKVKNPLDVSFALKEALRCRGVDASHFNLSHFIVTIHISYNNLVSGERLYSKLSLVDLAGSEALNLEDGSVDHASELLHVMKSLSALGDVLSSLTSKKDVVPYEKSILTRLLADSIGGNSKTLLITTVSSNASNMQETISSLNFASRARNTVLSLGNRDTTKRWRDIANGARKELLEKEKEMEDKKQEIFGMKLALKDANDQCVLLFNEVQKAWKVSYTLQSDLKVENSMLTDKLQIEKEQNTRLRNQVTQWMQQEQEHKLQMQQQDSKIQTLQAKIRSMEHQMNEALQSSQTQSKNTSESSVGVQSSPKASGDSMDSSIMTKKLEEELKKRDALIERLHEENEKLFDRLTVKASLTSSPQISSPSAKGPSSAHSQTDSNVSRGRPLDVVSVPVAAEKNVGSGALVKTSSDVFKTTPAGEYLTAALNDFDPEQHEGLAAMSDGANKLLMLVLAAVIKAGASREHEILAEIRDAVFSFIRKMEQKRVMDTMLVSRVRILYIRSLLARSPELQSIKVPPVEYFLEKPNSGRSRSSSRGNSPGRSPARYVEEKIQGFKVNIRPERKSKFSSVVLKLRGIDQETWRQHVTGGKLREITEEAKSFAIGNKSLAALFVHTPAGELQRQIRSWLAENFEFLSVTGDDAIGGTAGQLELLSTAIMDGWMAGLGAAMPPSTDALGQLLSDYTKRVYTSQLQHLKISKYVLETAGVNGGEKITGEVINLSISDADSVIRRMDEIYSFWFHLPHHAFLGWKDIAGTLATEDANDLAHVAKLRSALESVDHKRRKILQQMKGDEDLLTLGGSSPIRSPSTAAEDARLASLISLDSMLKQVKDILGQASTNKVSRSKKAAMLASLDDVEERMPSLLDIDHPCSQNQISDARRIVQSIVEVDDELEASLPQGPAESGSPAETDVAQWNVLQFNTASTTPFIIKCGSNSNSELVVKADAHVQEPKGSEIMRVIPRPSVLKNMSLEDIKQLFSQLPEALSLLALARTADGTRARYSRLYRTLASKVPSLRDLVAELEKGGD